VRAHGAAIAAAGASLVFVGTGTPAMAAAFAREHAGGHAVLSDANRALFAAAGMRRGWWHMLRPSLLRNLARALRRGCRQGRVQGDAWQLGGVLVVDRERRIRHVQRDAVAGAPLDFAAVVAAVRAAAGGRLS